jgi:hypothetical protein
MLGGQAVTPPKVMPVYQKVLTTIDGTLDGRGL